MGRYRPPGRRKHGTRQDDGHDWFSKARAEEDEAQGTQAPDFVEASQAVRARRSNGEREEAWSREAAKVAEEADFRCGFFEPLLAGLGSSIS